MEIIPLQKSETLDFSARPEKNFWRVKDAAAQETETSSISGGLTEFLQKAEAMAEVVFLASSELSNRQLTEWCLRLAEAGRRVYLLTRQKPSDFQALSGSCLMRFGLPIAGSLLLVNPQNNPQGLFYNGPFTEEIRSQTGRVLFEMDAGQTRAAFDFFAFHFWNSAEKEIIDKSATVQDCGEAPFGVTQPQDSSRQIEEMLANDQVSIAAFPSGAQDFSNTARKELLTDVGVSSPDETGAYNILDANDSPAPLHCYCSLDTGFILPTTDVAENIIQYCLKLNPGQLAETRQLFERLTGCARYRFETKKMRIELVDHKIKRQGADNLVSIKASAIRHEEIQAPEFLSREALNALKPEFEDDGASCEITYKWTILQFQLPEPANADPLYAEWEDKQQQFERQCKKLRADVDKAHTASEEKTKNLMKLLGQFKLGKQQKWKEIQQELQELAAKKLVARTRTERKKTVERLNEIQQEIAKSVAEVEQKVDEAKQQEKWEEERDKIKKEISDLEERLEKTNQEIAEKQSAYKTELEEREKRLQDFLQARKIDESDIPELERRLEEQAGKKNRVRNPEEAKAAAAELEKLRECNTKILTQKFESDNKRDKKASEDLEKKLERKKKALSAHGDKFVPKPVSNHLLGNLLGNNENKKTDAKNSFVINFPEENPPKVGKLFAHKGKRYLGISYWEEEEDGRAEAERLKAALCFNPNH